MSGTKEMKEEGEFQVHVLFIENSRLNPIPEFLENCKRYKEELKLDTDLKEAEKEYRVLLQKAKRPEYSKTRPHYERNLFDERRSQAPTLHDVLNIVSKRCPYTKWKKAMSEFIGLTPIQPSMQALTADEDQVFIPVTVTTKREEESEKPNVNKCDKEKIDKREGWKNIVPPAENIEIEDQAWKSKTYKVLTADVNQVYIPDEETAKGDEESEKTRPEDTEDQEEIPDTLRPEAFPDTEDQALKTEDNQEEDRDEDIFLDAMDGETKDHKISEVTVMFVENENQQPIANFLENCLRYKEDFQFGEELDEAVTEYNRLLQKAKETGCPVQKNAPPSQLNAVTPSEKCQAPCLYEVISDVAKRCPNAKWMDAVTEFITLTTYSQSEPRHAKHQRPRSTSGYQKKKEKEYRNSIEKLLDQDWDPEFIPKAAVEYDYRHFYTSESVLRSSFPDAYIFNMASSTLSKPDDVPLEFRERTLFHFLLSIDMKKYGVKPEDAWRDFGRCILAEKQLDLARRAVGPDLDKNVIVSKHNFYKLQNEVKEKTEEIEELSTRLSKFASQQLTEGNPNIADLSDTHRPTRLGEMYSQLFDDEWSEAFEAFKPKKDEDEEEEDDDIFPDTLFILQNMLKEIFEFCKTQSQKQLVELEDSFATVIGLKESKVRKQRDEKRTEENQIDGDGDSNEQPNLLDEIVQEKERKETDKTSDKKQLEDIQTPPADNGGENEQPKVSTGKTGNENIEGESYDKQTDEDKPGKSTDKDSEKDLSKEGAGEQPKPSEGDNDTNNQDTTVTDPEKGEDTSNNINNDSELDKNVNVEEKPKETSDKIQEGEQTSDEKAADSSEPNLDRNEESNEKSAEQPNIQQSTDKETAGGEEKKEEDKPEQSEGEEVPDKSPEEEDGGNEPDGKEEGGPEEEEKEEDRTYRADPAFPMIERHAREFRKASAGTSAKTKSTLFIKVELPNLVKDEGIREDLRTLTYVRKCVELCWYMCMQDPPMVIISPERGQEIDKGLFSLHGRRGKTVEVCVWPALLLHDGGPLVCKGYVLPEERKRKK